MTAALHALHLAEANYLLADWNTAPQALNELRRARDAYSFALSKGQS